MIFLSERTTLDYAGDLGQVRETDKITLRASAVLGWEIVVMSGGEGGADDRCKRQREPD